MNWIKIEDQWPPIGETVLLWDIRWDRPKLGTALSTTTIREQRGSIAKTYSHWCQIRAPGSPSEEMRKLTQYISAFLARRGLMLLADCDSTANDLVKALEILNDTGSAQAAIKYLMEVV